MSPFDSDLSHVAPDHTEAPWRPSRAAAEAAVRTLIAWTGANPNREGLSDTPARVVRAYEEMFGGYRQDPVDLLSRTFNETGGYDEPIVLTGIRFVSHCEHHLSPIVGYAHIAYVPDGSVVGISKLARLVELYARRLQIQERMTMQIARALETVLRPKGVGVILEGVHHCMVARGVRTPSARMVTRAMRGQFATDAELRASFERRARSAAQQH